VTDFDSSEYTLASALAKLGERVKELEAFNSVVFEIKATTGDPAPKGNYHFVINTFDNTLKCYADGGWRTLASGW